MYTDETGSEIEVDCKVEYSNFIIYDKSEIGNGNHYIRLHINDSFYTGIGYHNIEFMTAKYEFYYHNTDKVIPIKNTFFTANSLTWNEGVAYKTKNNSPAYLNEDYYGTYSEVRNSGNFDECTNTIYSQIRNEVRYFYGRAVARNNPHVENNTEVQVNDENYVWFDDWLGKASGKYTKDFEKGSVSFLLNGIDENDTSFEFIFSTKFKRLDHGAWMAPSTSPLGTPRISPKKTVDRTEVSAGEEVNYTITQRLHKTGINIITNYLSFKMEDKLPQEVEYISSEISSPDIENLSSHMKFDFDRSSNTISYDANNTEVDPFLDNLDLTGQIITLNIKCKVKRDQSNTASTYFGNKSTTYMNYDEDKGKKNKFNSNEVFVQILPEFNPKITKVSNPTTITDTEQRVKYTINYSNRVLYYQGNSTITIVDTLPYKIDTGKKYDLNGGKYNESNKTITWTENINNINSFKNQNSNIQRKKEISVVFAGVNTKATSMTNNVKTTINTETPKKDNTIEGSVTTNFDFKIDVIAKKNWDDQGRDRSRRPELLTFVLYENGKPTDKSYALSPKTKDDDEYTFKDLPKYDSNGKRINYEVKEISKQSGNNYYRLQDIKTNVVEDGNDLRYYVDSTTSQQDSNESGGRTKTDTIKNTYKSINIRGNVWLDSGIDGRRTNEEIGFKGVNVQILFKHGSKTNVYAIYNTVRTDENGNYSFDDIPWNGTYKIRFKYNGQIYETTYYKNDLSGGYSNAKEYDDERNSLNTRFENINAYPNNYDNGKRAFGLYEKIKSVTTNDFIYNSNGNPYTFINDVLPEFNNVEIDYNEYNDDFFNALRVKLQNKNIDANTANSLADYLRDCIINADTDRDYYITDPQGLKPGADNTFSSVDLGLSERVRSNLSIRNDIYKITYIINGKQFDEYEGYNNKPSNIYSVEERAKNGYYNGEFSYNKPIYKSDYLYNGASVVPGGENRNLQMYITYKTIITNNGQVSATVRSLDNYYDSRNYENFSETKNLKACQDNNKLGSFVDEDTNEMLKDYKKLKLTTNNPVLLHPGESTEVDLTFKVKSEYDRIKISETKRNIAEINSYSTYYMPEDNTSIPDTLQGNNKVNKKITARKSAGLVDVDSDPGSLRDTDLTLEGDLIYSEQKGTEEYQRIENDTDKAPNLNITLSGESRSINGFVFEDNRNVIDNNLKTAIGNGRYDDGETRVNGVTVQLVEFVREIDPVTKLQTDNYAGEYVWSEWKYKNLEELPSIVEEEKSYYTGKGTASIIISGEGDWAVPEIPLGEDSAGKYQFNSFIPGDYYIRFTYGDTDRTVLTDANSAVAKAQAMGQLNEINEPLTVNSVVNGNGLNAKSYNGQDFKSTVYQPGVNQSEIASYNGINGYTNYENQNFINNIEDYYNYKIKEEERKSRNEKVNQYIKTKDKMYLYSNAGNVSNAKDLYGDRQRIQDLYGEKIVNELYDDKLTGITNRSGEVLQSYEKLASNDKGDLVSTQKSMLEELKNNTQMRAQSGVIDVEITHNNGDVNQANLGLVERAKAQVTLMKEVTSVSVVLQNGKSLFNTGQSVGNLYFGKHNGHVLNYDGYRIDTNNISINRKNGEEQPELIQAYIDDELMAGATLSARYRITAKNQGEVDFNDNEFYYSGVEKDPENNITKTIVNRAVDYISNTVLFDLGKQTESSSWKIVKPEDLINNGLVTGKFGSIMKTYNTILVTEGLNKELLPEQFKKENSSASVELVLDSALANVLSRDSLVYNNMTELIQVTNQQGRRSGLSIPGNEEMADQTLGSNAIRGYSMLDRKEPKEIDADSAQRIVVMPPTGEEDNSWLILVSVISAGIIAGGLLVIKKLLFSH